MSRVAAAVFLNNEVPMRIEQEAGPRGTKFMVVLSEPEALNLNESLEAESRAWQATFRDRVKAAGSLNAVKQLAHE
jgi:hypothetical protein